MNVVKSQIRCQIEVIFNVVPSIEVHVYSRPCMSKQSYSSVLFTQISI
jgi:hypothetical protein